MNSYMSEEVKPMRLGFKAFEEMRPLKLLKESKHQRNKHPEEQIRILAKVMAENKVRQPIHLAKINGVKTNEIAFGHGRKQAAEFNGWHKFPVIWQEFESDDEYYLCVQSDNGLAKYSELDFAQINLDILDRGPFDIELLGIPDFKVEPLDKLVVKPVEDKADKASTKLKTCPDCGYEW